MYNICLYIYIYNICIYLYIKKKKIGILFCFSFSVVNGMLICRPFRKIG